MTYQDKLERRRKRLARHLRLGLRWFRHGPECPVGKHCEDPHCHYSGDCCCGLDTYLDGRLSGQCIGDGSRSEG